MTPAPPSDHDYVSPGLAAVRPDAGFPHMTPRDRTNHPWPYLRREIPHLWYADERYPLMGFLNRDEATLLHNIALQFRGRRALEIGSWLGWSTCHLGLAGVELDVIDPAHDDAEVRASVEAAVAHCGIGDRVHLTAGRSPDSVDELAARFGRKWSLFFIDGDHEGLAPLLDTLACRPHAEPDCAFVFHDLNSPAVANALRFLRDDGFHVLVYQTAQIMGIAWRGNVTPVRHVPDPEVRWVVPEHLRDLPISESGGQVGEWASGQVGEWTSRTFSEHAPRPLAHSTTRPLPSVCVVTNEVIGPFKNGGIGTAMTGLAETLAESGHRVTVLYTGHAGTAAVGLDRWREVYRAKGIELVALTLEDSSHLDGPVRHASLGTPWLIYAYLVEHRFDVVHFNDCRGEGSLALAAKRLNIAFHDTLLAVGLHSPSQWVLELNNTAKSSTPLAAFSYAEHLSVKCADLIWSPSRYMVGWVRDHDFALPAETFIQQYAIPATAPFPAMESRRTAKPTEIVFFGRLEERKGLRLFCNALDSLRDELAARNVTITFLGKPHTCGGMSSLEYLAKRSRDWRFPTQILTDHGQPEALAYLRANDRVAVIASPVDNSPCTVYEALAWGLPFLASRGGGIPELIHEDDRDQVLFDHSTPALRAALLDVLDHGGFTARPSVTQAESRRSWSAMHANWRAFLPPPPRMSHVGPRNIVALVDHDGRANLDATLESLKTCANIRRIVVLASAAPYVGQTLLSVLANQQKGQTGVSVLHRDPDALRGVLASLADDAVLLVHSGLTVLPDALERMRVSLRAEGVEGFLPAGLLHGEKRNPILPPLGGSAPFALFEGATFTGGLLVRADVLLRAASNRALAIESAFLGLADFCIVHGEIWPFPEIAFEGPEKTWPRPRSEDPARVAVYAECSPTDRLYITAAGYAATQRVAAPYGRRQIALALIDAGFAPLVRAGVWGLRHARRAVRGLRKR